MSKKRLDIKSSFALEEAYCLYRLGKFTSSLNLIEKEGDCKDDRFQLLKGQVLYRLEQFKEAADIFESLLNSNNGEFGVDELKVNLLAASAQAGINSGQLPEDEIRSFDKFYNQALVELSSSEYKKAESLATDCEAFGYDENVRPTDLVNSKLAAICASMNDPKNIPEAEYLLRKLKSSSCVTPLQDILITSNLMAINSGKESFSSFDASVIDKLSLFKSQKQQILINANHAGVTLSDSQLKTIKASVNSVSMVIEPSCKFVSVEDLKAEVRNIRKHRKREFGEKSAPTKSAPADKERWLPLRDRSYYKSKAQYLKTLKNTKSSSSKK